eukprot:Clim_evm140s157 gene=Clim_evmTU140s157
MACAVPADFQSAICLVNTRLPKRCVSLRKDCISAYVREQNDGSLSINYVAQDPAPISSADIEVIYGAVYNTAVVYFAAYDKDGELKILENISHPQGQEHDYILTTAFHRSSVRNYVHPCGIASMPLGDGIRKYTSGIIAMLCIALEHLQLTLCPQCYFEYQQSLKK